MTRSERAAASVKGSTIRKSNIKSEKYGLDSEKGISLGIKLTTKESASGVDSIGKLANISERVFKNVEKHPIRF